MMEWHSRQISDVSNVTPGYCCGAAHTCSVPLPRHAVCAPETRGQFTTRKASPITEIGVGGSGGGERKSLRLCEVHPSLPNARFCLAHEHM